MEFVQNRIESTVIIDMMNGDHSAAIKYTETTAVIDTVVSEHNTAIGDTEVPVAIDWRLAKQRLG